MKKKYFAPQCSVTTIEIEDSYCNASSNITIGNIDSDYQQEWDELPDDNREIKW